ncbi:MAG: DUF4139 domain-containing protein [Ignavibacteriae bacterium]|nr:DUF4139 domain-containing protein [Ignavibacteriota bacterium]NOG99187.1 DUF4139 domain-containing protein [Ignavibacteriota bacterium]
MKIKSILTLLTLFFAITITAQNNQQKEIAVTVYNSDLGVIKDLRSMNINSGTSQIQLTDVAKLIDPTSVHIKLDGKVVEQNYQYDLVSMDKILQKYIDKDIQLFSESGEMISGNLLSVLGSQIVLKKNDGGLLMLPNTSKYRVSVDALPEGLITKPTLVWMVNSNSSGKQDVEITYQTRGMNWHAEYVAVLNEDDTKTDLNSWVSIDNNSGTTYKNAKLKLVAGDVNRISQNLNYPVYAVDAMRKEGEYSAAQFGEKEFFEYHIYNLERATTLAQNETKQISLFESSGVNVTKKFLYRSGSYNRGSSGKVAVIVEFDNKEKNNLGVPMPKGKVRVYKSDGESVEFIGEDMIDHTPRNEKVKLKIGDAFDLVAEEVQTENKRISNKVSEQAYEITLKNRKKEDVVIEVERYLGLNWNILNSSVKYEKKDAQNVIFKVPVKKDDTSVLKFKVRYSY